MNSVQGDIIQPKVLIVPIESPCPSVSGAGVKGMLCVSGASLFVVNDNSGTWQAVGNQTGA
jgi:hypothetical protein